MNKKIIYAGLVLSIVSFAVISMNSSEEKSLQDVVYFDAGNDSGVEDGTLDYPYNTLGEALSHSDVGGTVILESGSPTPITIDQPVTLSAPNGTVRIGSNMSRSYKIWQSPRVAYVDIVSYRGMMDAEHWYGKVKSGNGKFSEELVYPLTSVQAKSLSRRDGQYSEGDLTYRFFTFTKLIETAVEVASRKRSLEFYWKGT